VKIFFVNHNDINEKQKALYNIKWSGGLAVGGNVYDE
jgi:hypothetical protein